MNLKCKKMSICLTDKNLELVELIKNKMEFNSRSESINYILEHFSTNNNIENKVKDLTDKYTKLLNKNYPTERINNNSILVKDTYIDKEVKLEIDKEIIVLNYSDTEKDW